MRAQRWALCLSLAACGGSKSNNNNNNNNSDMHSTGGGDMGSGPGHVTVVPNVVAGAHLGTGGSSSFGLGAEPRLHGIGVNTATSLTSLKYFIQNIQLCQELQIQGSGWSNANKCITLYSFTPPDGGAAPDYNTYLVEQAVADSDATHYVDLMTADGQAKLAQNVMLDASAIGTYKYGLINFFRPIKATAQFPILGSSTDYYRTKGIVPSGILSMQNGMFTSERVLIGDTLSGATEETTYMLNNGGTWFVFQKPFEIAQADIDAGTQIKVDLVFNPDSFGQAHDQGMGYDCTADVNNTICDQMNKVTMEMPYVRMSPVPRKAGQKTRKETYKIDYSTGTKLRLELYYNDADPEKSIQGVDAAVVYDSTATQQAANAVATTYVSQTGSVTTNDAMVTFKDWDNVTDLVGLHRGANGQVTITCTYVGGICTSSGAVVMTNYTYVDDTVVSSD